MCTCFSAIEEEIFVKYFDEWNSKRCFCLSVLYYVYITRTTKVSRDISLSLSLCLCVCVCVCVPFPAAAAVLPTYPPFLSFPLTKP